MGKTQDMFQLVAIKWENFFPDNLYSDNGGTFIYTIFFVHLIFISSERPKIKSNKLKLISNKSKI